MLAIDRASIPFWWRWGKPADIWVRQVELIEQIIRTNQLKPVAEAGLGLGVMAVEAGREMPAALLRPGDLRGGMRGPHVHFAGEVYLLNEAQWREFTRTVMKGYQSKLTAAKAVGFEQMLEISNAMESLP
jgi:hypothetical protein